MFAAVVLTLLLSTAACGSQQATTTPTTDAFAAQLQPVVDDLAAWRQSAFPADLKPAELPAALEKRQTALSNLDQASARWAGYLATRADLAANPKVGPSLIGFSDALKRYVTSVTAGMNYFKKCLPASPGQKQLEHCESSLNQRYGAEVSQAEAQLQSALTQLTISAYTTPTATP